MSEKPAESLTSNIKSEFIIFPLTFVASVLTARILGPENKGIQAIVLLIYTTLIPLFSLGSSAGIRFYLTNYYSLSESIKTIIFILFGYMSFNVFLVGIISYFGWFQIESISSENILFPVILGILPVYSKSVLTRVFISQSKFRSLNKITIVYKVIYFTLIVVVYLSAINGLKGVIYSMIICEFIYGFVLWYYISKLFDLKSSFDFRLFKKIHAYGFQAWTSEVLRISNRRVDQLILSFLVPLNSLGLYYVAVSLSELVQLLPSKAIPILFNIINKEENPIIRKNILVQSHRIILFVTIGLSITLAAAGYFIINFLYGKEFSYSFFIFLLYLPGTITYMGTRVILQYFGAVGKPFYLTLIQLSGILMGLPLYFILIPFYGVIGAAISSSIAYSITSFVAILLVSETSFLAYYQINRNDIKNLIKYFNQIKSFY